MKPFEVGQKVRYWNHVMGYDIDTLTVFEVNSEHVIAETAGGMPRRFTKDGVASWTGNLSIQHINEETQETT